MAVAAHTSVLKTTGTPVAMTGEATTSISSSVYQITDTSRRIISPASALQVYDNAVPVLDTDVTIDYLFGKITKNSGSFTGPVTIDGVYIPSFAFAEVRAFEINCTNNLQETTVMAAATAERSRIAALKDCSGSMTGLDPLTTDLNPGPGTVKPREDWAGGGTTVFEVTFPGGVIFRSFVKFKDIADSANFDGLYESVLSWEANALTGVDQTEGSSFGFSSGG